MKKNMFLFFLFGLFFPLYGMMTLSAYKKELAAIKERIKKEKQEKESGAKLLEKRDADQTVQETTQSPENEQEESPEIEVIKELEEALLTNITGIKDMNWQRNTKYECLVAQDKEPQKKIRNKLLIRGLSDSLCFDTATNRLPLLSFSISSRGTLWVTYVKEFHKEKKKIRKYKHTICFQRPGKFINLFALIKEKYNQQ